MEMDDGKVGKVYIVGAGPGDPGLLTLKAKTLLETADVVLYDRLVSDEILNIVPKTAKLVCVGKASGGDEKTPQHEINRLMMEEACKGKKVVRLKGGDPFNFGRGGEEAEFLARNGVPFEVVPGVSSAIAVPALAGIPLTHREYSSALLILTGHSAAEHEDEKRKYEELWRHAAKLDCTLVILMGVKSLERNVALLLEGGKSPETPVAIIERGATPQQRVIVGTLRNIVEVTREKNVKPPAVVVVGSVVRLREVLKRSLES
ncbi:MAG TPA: uroporphyrinogen-III C-methyltransferase [Methanomicrobia archaeon]|nr:uroporphyrinogen-III C-methyltransferase [Methanomicrobia archaeon]HEX59926.1 uroporphyrinogen-III C-methyltransferase [Methanomicrobia archaeon]